MANGTVEVTPSGENVNLYIKGPQGGLRHWVIIPRPEAWKLAEEIQAQVSLMNQLRSGKEA